MDLRSTDAERASVRTARMREMRRLAAEFFVSDRRGMRSINTRRIRDATIPFDNELAAVHIDFAATKPTDFETHPPTPGQGGSLVSTYGE